MDVCIARKQRLQQLKCSVCVLIHTYMYDVDIGCSASVIEVIWAIRRRRPLLIRFRMETNG